MITHYIILSSSYSTGKRIALHYVLNDKEEDYEIKNAMNVIIQRCGKDVSVSTHYIETDEISWKSVIKKDYFFKNVKVIDTLDEFTELIQQDRKLLGLDIAKYILSKITCTQLKIQKLVYFCFAEYLCETGKKLFTDPIYAFKYGPVVESVYDKYRRYGYKPIDEETKAIKGERELELPAKSRIMFAEDGAKKIFYIDKTLGKYGNLSAGELVSITHRENTPWSKTYKDYVNEKYQLIDAKVIRENHKFETI